MKKTLQLEGIHKKYEENHILKGLSLNVEKSEIAFLVGPNGAGKTTLVKTILGLMSPDEGEIVFNKEQLTIPFPKKVKAELGYIPDEPIFIEYLTGMENLKYYSHIYKKKMKEKELLDLLENYELKDASNQLVKLYSRGMRQKLSLCFMDIVNPELIVMDEPTIGLDLLSINFLKKRLLKFKEDNKSLLITTHDMSFCQDIADTIYILNDGKATRLSEDFKETDKGIFEDQILQNLN
ncbi:ABC transporter ATP-binding protein [Halobacillus sp. B23F22_1]|uniref:ABC transporter ATP-binding protein n=1 Tax=Halobacillus sp. B23F22_1 TaxID=3459514 RepID=UPI00373EA2E6